MTATELTLAITLGFSVITNIGMAICVWLREKKIELVEDRHAKNTITHNQQWNKLQDVKKEKDAMRADIDALVNKYPPNSVAVYTASSSYNLP